MKNAALRPHQHVHEENAAVPQKQHVQLRPEAPKRRRAARRFRRAKAYVVLHRVPALAAHVHGHGKRHVDVERLARERVERLGSAVHGHGHVDGPGEADFGLVVGHGEEPDLMADLGRETRETAESAHLENPQSSTAGSVV